MEVRSVETIVKSLNDAQVEYLIVGGLAVISHGYERFTHAVDIVIGLEANNILKGPQALLSIDYHPSIPVKPEDFADPVNRETWRRDKNMVVLKLWSDIHRRTPIDVFVYEPFDFAREYAAAKWEEVLGTIKAPVVGYTSLIAMKRLAGRLRILPILPSLKLCKRSGTIGRMTKEELYAHPGWEWCTFEGARKHVHLRGLKTTFREKLEWLEAAETNLLAARSSREQRQKTERTNAEG